LRRTDVLLDALEATGAGDRHDPPLLGEQPGQRDLPRGGALGRGEGSHVVDDRGVHVSVLRGEAGDGPADVSLGEGRGGVDGPGEEALAERTERDEADSELGAGGQHLRLGVAGPQRVLGLDRCDRVDGVGAANRAGTGLRRCGVILARRVPRNSRISVRLSTWPAYERISGRGRPRQYLSKQGLPQWAGPRLACCRRHWQTRNLPEEEDARGVADLWVPSRPWGRTTRRAAWVIAGWVADWPWWSARRRMPRSPRRPCARCPGPDGRSR